MKTLKLPKSNLDYFAAVLQAFGELHAPVERNGTFVFRPVKRWSEARLDYTRTALPPKKYVLPPRERLFHFDTARGYKPVTEGLDRRVVLFGVHACDIYGLNLLDEVFQAGRYPDPYYQARRKNLAIIGIDCTPDEHCFCRSMRADFVDHGFDLFLHDLGDAYLVHVATALGDDMVLSTAPLFTEVARADVEEYKRRSAQKRDAFQLEVEIRDLPEIFEMEYASDVWEQLGERCLACGACTAVCPTCYCYDVTDDPELGSRNGDRTRTWDSCLFHTHALVAGGENFREDRASRIKFRFYHKQRAFVAEYGRPACVGCGRCITACPASIHIGDVISQLRGANDVAIS
jgi:sulfhydrogenase subunit beta (sulfur reductase)